MNPDFQDKRVLVTGSSRGVGRAIATYFHAAGCKVALNGRGGADLEQAKVELKGALAVPGDMSLPEQAERVVEEVVSRHGQLDVLVCNVGGGRSVPPGAETPEEWHRMFALNLWSVTNTVAAARRYLALTKGTIVCISSICGLEVIPGAPLTYSAAKSALHSYVRGMARPLGKDGVRINAVALGNMLFEGSVWARKLREEPEQVEAMLTQNVALSKLGSPAEAAEIVGYLASRRAAFVTGAVWVVDGGQIRSGS